MISRGAEGRIFVIGAGLAGLSAAVRLTKAGAAVTLIEAASQAGGRCRSYFDGALGAMIDNGNHLVLSGNQETFAYLRATGAEGCLTGPNEARLDFLDRRDGARWTIRANDGPLPWWLAAPSRRVAGTGLADYASATALLFPPAGRTVSEVMRCEGLVWERLLEPFLLAALNTPARAGSARLASAVVRRTLALGGRAYKPRVASPTLAAAFVDPALAALRRAGAEIRFARAVRALSLGGEHVSGLVMADGELPLGLADQVVLAVPPWAARDLIPDLIAPDAFSPILNAHFLHPPPAAAPPVVGIVGGAAQWVFAFGDRLSTTVSAADDLINEDREKLAARIWADVAAVHRLRTPAPPFRIIKERRATFAATPDQDARRPAARTAWRNLFLAGDWIQTGLPATIEGAIGSGARAARLVLRQRAGGRPAFR